MVIATGAETAVDAIKELLDPVVNETTRKGRKAIVRTQHVAEDAAAVAALGIRRRPLSSVMTAAGIGALVGALVGFGLGQTIRCRE